MIIKALSGVLVVLFMTFSVYSQDIGDYLKKGTKLRYYLHDSGNDYEFIVDIKGLGEVLEFNWWMTSPANNRGSVKITKHAVDSAIYQQNYFHGGHDELTNTTTVWLSKKVYHALKNKGSIEIYPEESSVDLAFVDFKDYPLKVDGKQIMAKTIYAEGSNGDKFWILDDPENPIILKMVISFNIEIGEIMTQAYWED